MKNRFDLSRRVWISIVAIALLAGLAWAATRGGPLAATRVTVVQVFRGDISPGISGIGTVAAERTYALGPTSAGRVKRVLVDVGDTVKAGQLLAEMEPVDLDAREAAASAATLRSDSAVTTAEAQVQDARSRQKLAASEVLRHIDLGNKGFISASAVEGKRQQLESADAQLAAAVSALASARQDKLRLEAELGGARLQRTNMRLVATANGTVTAREAEPGSAVVAGQTVLKMADMANLRVRTRIDQGRAAGLRTGLAAQIALRSRPAEMLAGKLVRIDPLSDSVTEERVAEIAFDQIPAGVSIGELAEVTLQLPNVKDALLIPNASLRRHAGLAGVWLHSGGRLRFAAVKAGARSLDGKVQILEGLQAGDEVVVHSERDLADGGRIEVVATLFANGNAAP